MKLIFAAVATYFVLTSASPAFGNESSLGAGTESFANKRAAAEAGDPSATAPSIAMPESATYNGTTISMREARDMGLACDQSSNGLFCTDPVPTEDGTTDGANTYNLCKGLKVLALYQHAQRARCSYSGEGWMLTLSERGVWVPMGDYGNAASAFAMGNRSGRLADYASGDGPWYPGDTSAGAARKNLGNCCPDGWNNRISARYRN